MDQIRIAIVDDHGIFIKGLKTLFKSFRDIKILMEAENGLRFIEKLKNDTPDIVLLDVDMPEMDGIETTAYLTKHHPDLRVIILTHHNSEEIMLHLIELGARGFLLKNNTIETIVDAIYSVKENGYFFNDKVPRALVRELMTSKKIIPRYDKVNLMHTKKTLLRKPEQKTL
jgi:two-component system, NarL family, response regulator DegU